MFRQVTTPENKLPRRFLIRRLVNIRYPLQLRLRRPQKFRLRRCSCTRLRVARPHLHCQAVGLLGLPGFRNGRSRERKLTSQKLRSSPIGKTQPFACQVEPMLV